MADVQTIRIDPNGYRSPLLVAASHAIFWGYLVGAEAASHLLFGGSWVIDVMILVSLGIIVWSLACRAAGMIVTMTPDEIRKWVAGGMAYDIKAWRETQKPIEELLARSDRKLGGR